jgi:hypothetical protein
MDIELADTMPDGWQLWLDWHKANFPDNRMEIQALETDSGSYLAYVRLIGRRRADAQLMEPIVSVPPRYTKKPLRRGSEYPTGNLTANSLKSIMTNEKLYITGSDIRATVQAGNPWKNS